MICNFNRMVYYRMEPSLLEPSLVFSTLGDCQSASSDLNDDYQLNESFGEKVLLELF